MLEIIEKVKNLDRNGIFNPQYNIGNRTKAVLTTIQTKTECIEFLIEDPHVLMHLQVKGVLSVLVRFKGKTILLPI